MGSSTKYDAYGVVTEAFILHSFSCTSARWCRSQKGNSTVSTDDPVTTYGSHQRRQRYSERIPGAILITKLCLRNQSLRLPSVHLRQT